jgi:hypothetical protein
METILASIRAIMKENDASVVADTSEFDAAVAQMVEASPFIAKQNPVIENGYPQYPLLPSEMGAVDDFSPEQLELLSRVRQAVALLRDAVMQKAFGPYNPEFDVFPEMAMMSDYLGNSVKNLTAEDFSDLQKPFVLETVKWALTLLTQLTEVIETAKADARTNVDYPHVTTADALIDRSERITRIDDYIHVPILRIPGSAAALKRLFHILIIEKYFDFNPHRPTINEMMGELLFYVGTTGQKTTVKVVKSYVWQHYKIKLDSTAFKKTEVLNKRELDKLFHNICVQLAIHNQSCEADTSHREKVGRLMAMTSSYDEAMSSHEEDTDDFIDVEAEITEVVRLSNEIMQQKR